MAAPTIDDSQWPVVLIVYPEAGTTADVDEYMVELEKLFHRGQRWVAVVDLSAIDRKRATQSIRRYVTEAVDRLWEKYPDVQLGEAAVAKSLVLRRLLLANSWLRRVQSVERKVFATREEAFAWARALLASQAAPELTATRRPPTPGSGGKPG
jgi:hypothetical protein